MSISKDDRAIKATHDRMLKYLGYVGATGAITFNDVEYPERRTRMVVTHGGAEYEVHVRVSNGEVKLFRGFGNASIYDIYPLRKGQRGHGSARKMLAAIRALGPSQRWVERHRAEREALARVETNRKAEVQAVSKVRESVRRVARDLGLADRMTLHGVSPDGVIGGITIQGPWTPEDLRGLLRFLANRNLP